MIFSDVPIRGAFFRGRDILNAVNEMQPGQRLTFEREPENPHDPNAVKALVEGVHIGYVGREYAGWVCNSMDEGVVYEGVVTSMQAGQKGNLEPWITMFPQGNEPAGLPQLSDELPYSEAFRDDSGT